MSYVSALRLMSHQVTELVKSIQQFSALPDNWDGTGADPVSMQCIQEAIRVVYAFNEKGQSINDAYPLRGGGIVLSSKMNKFKLNVELHPDGENIFLVFDENADSLLDGDFKIDELKNILGEVASLGR